MIALFLSAVACWCIAFWCTPARWPLFARYGLAAFVSVLVPRLLRASGLL